MALTAGIGYAEKGESDNPMAGTFQFLHRMNQNNLVASAKLMPAHEYSFRPTEQMRSFGELVAHIADANYLFCSSAKGEADPIHPDLRPGAAGGRPDEIPKNALERKLKSKDEIVAALEASFAYCQGVFDGLSDASLGGPAAGPFPFGTRSTALGLSVYHNGNHYGNLVVYLRLKGLNPPTGEPRRPLE